MGNVKDLAYQDYLSGMKYKNIAEKHKVSLSTVKSWAARNWKKVAEKRLQPEGKKVATNNKKLQPKKEEDKLHNLMVASVELNAELTDKQRLFCLCFMKNFNATQAVINAGYDVNSSQSASEIGYQLLQLTPVQNEIRRLKSIRANALLVSQDDILERYMRIAFADITDFVDFYPAEVPVIANGKVVMMENTDTEEPVPLTKNVNIMRFKDANMVDGGIICEISQDKDGSRIKLEARLKALEWLSKYFAMNPLDKHKIDYDNKKLALEERAANGGADELNSWAESVLEADDP